MPSAVSHTNTHDISAQPLHSRQLFQRSLPLKNHHRSLFSTTPTPPLHPSYNQSSCPIPSSNLNTRSSHSPKALTSSTLRPLLAHTRSESSHLLDTIGDLYANNHPQAHAQTHLATARSRSPVSQPSWIFRSFASG